MPFKLQATAFGTLRAMPLLVLLPMNTLIRAPSVNYSVNGLPYIQSLLIYHASLSLQSMVLKKIALCCFAMMSVLSSRKILKVS